MYQIGIFLLTAVSCALSIKNWRWGPFFMVAIGLLQDPVRKLTPGAPAYLLLPAAAVWGSTIVGAIASGDLSFPRYRAVYPRMSRAMGLFAILLIPSAIASATYGPDSWKVTVVGLFIYGSLLMGMVAGTFFPQRPQQIVRFLAWYVILSIPVSLGGVLEKAGVTHGAIGTSAMGHQWITYRMGSQGVHMIAGFLRSPDTNGWHAATAAMVGLTLAFCLRRRLASACMLLISAFATVNVLLCARRKMLAMLAVYIVVFFLLHMRHLKARYVTPLIILVVFVAAVGLRTYDYLDPGSESRDFLGSTVRDAPGRVSKHGWQTTIGTYRQAGFFGYGVGMATQGVQNIAVERPRIWQEAGMSKLMAELGVLGTLGFLLLAWTVANALWKNLQRVRSNPKLFAIHAGLTSILAANASSGIVSAQIFGDPFIAALLSLLLGMALSPARLRQVGASVVGVAGKVGTT